MEELIKALTEIGEAHKDDFVAFPMFIKKEDVDLLGYAEQKSDISSFKFEYINRTVGHCVDDFSGYILYPFKDMFIKVYFEC